MKLPRLTLKLGAAGAGLQDLPGQRRDGLPVRRGLGGQAQHEIELEQVPARREGLAGRGQDDLFRQVLVDHPAQAVGAGLRGQGHAGAPHPL